MKTFRLPLVTDVQSRNSSTAKDARIVNGYIEQVQDRQYIVKRPGLVMWHTPATPTSGNGMYIFNGNIYAGEAASLYKLDAFGNATIVGTTGVLGGLVSIAGTAVAGFIAGVTVASGSSGKLYFTNTNTMPYLFLHNTTNAWTLNGSTGTLAQITDLDFPTNQIPKCNLVPGTVYMNNTVFVMTTDGRIYNSAVEDPTSWGALDYISLVSEPDKAVTLSKTNNYLVAFSKNYTEFFYYNGAPTGSPLAVNLSAKLEIGCDASDSVVKFPNKIMFVGTSKEAGRSVYMLNGTSYQAVSTKAIETYLNIDVMTNVSAFAIGIAGHDFYVLTLKNSNITLVYDLITGQWAEWSSLINGVEQFFETDNYVADGSTTYLQNSAEGYIAKLDYNTFTDEGLPIPFRVVSPIFEGTGNNIKFFQSMEVIGDRVSGTLQIRHTDDDYQTWSSYRTVNLNQSRPIIRQLGSARRRAYEFYDEEAKPLRILGVDILLREGTF